MDQLARGGEIGPPTWFPKHSSGKVASINVRAALASNDIWPSWGLAFPGSPSPSLAVLAAPRREPLQIRSLTLGHAFTRV